jgi:hypothetical protein
MLVGGEEERVMRRGDLQSFIRFRDVYFEGFAKEGVVGLDREIVEDVLKVRLDGLGAFGAWRDERHVEIGLRVELVG